MLPTEVVEREENGLLRRMVLHALGMGVGQPREAPERHPANQIEALDMRRANLVGVRVGLATLVAWLA
jgi:hypothetical protein